ncbi:CPBP family intramembrane glutamic endopeptidase [Candidatus Leptofilum sp.]|uniref:CPBP family intramembrane glutamic endopeptidase n=1 Tax=Candidatus Leptofilum sp. TaxID=3241576 RepID=UPI003B5C47A7
MTATQFIPKTQYKRLARPLVFFFGLAYALAWGALGVLHLIARQSGIESGLVLLQMGEAFQFGNSTPIVAPWIIYLLTRLADFAFSIAGIVTIALTTGREGLLVLWQRLTRWRMAWRWYALGLLPLGLYGVAVLVAGGVESAKITSTTLTTVLFSLHSGFFVSLFLRGAFGEEFGLRGFALPYLQERMSPFRASLVIGVLWGAWHLPVLWGRDALSIVAFALLSIGLSMLFTLLFNGSGGSLIPVLLFHATQNWEEGFETFFPALVGTDWELISTLSLLVVGLIAGIILKRAHTRW